MKVKTTSSGLLMACCTVLMYERTRVEIKGMVGVNLTALIIYDM